MNDFAISGGCVKLADQSSPFMAAFSPFLEAGEAIGVQSTMTTEAVKGPQRGVARHGEPQPAVFNYAYLRFLIGGFASV